MSDAKDPRAFPGRPSISATEAQNNFGRVLNQVVREGAVYITKYDEPTAVVLSIHEYRALTEPEGSRLDALAGEFDALLARMKSPGSAAGIDALFAMQPAGLGEAALRGARGAKERDATRATD